jgi:hypothetical protein
LADLQVKCQPPLADVTVRPHEQQRGAFQVRFAPREHLPIGRHEFTVKVTGVNAAGKKLTPAGFQVFADVVPDVKVSPSVVHFGSLRVGERKSSDVIVRSRTGQYIDDVTVGDNPAASVQIREGQSDTNQCHFEVSCQSDAVGLHVFTIQLDVRAGRATPQRVPLVVCYTGIDAKPAQPPAEHTATQQL